MVDGVVVMDVEINDARVPALRDLDRPSVLIGFPGDAAGLTCVDLDFYRAGGACVAYLAGLGHTELALLGAPAVVYERNTGFARRTRSGFLDAAGERGLAATAEPCEETAEGVGRVVAGLLARRPDVTALAVHNEAAVGHVLAALAANGRRVPADISVVAICPDEVAERFSPALTSVPIPADEVGAQAVRLLMSKLLDQPVPAATLLEPTLTVRDSTARAPALKDGTAPAAALQDGAVAAT
jgi:DNA-binding LacI/PurR family transcriptional regulator